MNTTFKVISSALALTACMVALGTFASLLFDAVRGARSEFGALGTLVLAALLVGQCRILWILVDPKSRRRVDEADVATDSFSGPGASQSA